MMFDARTSDHKSMSLTSEIEDASDFDDSLPYDFEASMDHTNHTKDSAQIGDGETRTLMGIKLIFVLVLLASAAGAFGISGYIRKTENSEFKNQFNDDANKVLASMGAALDNTLSSTDAFVASMISTAEQTNQSWPFVQIPDWAVRAGKVRQSSMAWMMNLYMWVESEQRNEWESWAKENNQWVMDTARSQAADPGFKGNNEISPEYTDFDYIHDYSSLDAGLGTNSTGPWMVWWQCTPVLVAEGAQPVYNWDLTSWYPLTNCSGEVEPCNEYQNSLDVTVKKHEVVISEAYMIVPEDATADDIQLMEYEAEWVSTYLPPDENPVEPISDIYYPILPSGLDTFNQNTDSFDRLNQTFAGHLTMSFFWRSTIRDILPIGSDGIVVVFENPCNPTFTYQINGPEEIFLGGGDHHDPKYDHLGISSKLNDLKDYAIKGSRYTGLPLANDFCPWKINIYPSDTMKKNYISTNATIFSLTAAGIFIATSIIFLIYDLWVERRQRIVMDSATRTQAIVSSLFPKNVQERILGMENGGNTFETHAKTLGQPNAPPVADLFAETTVCFIDIVGFTAWSSVREPSQVFFLLETLYGAFDKIAEKRGVFKVETVGDSYVCVTGLPHPQKNHATIMVLFANDAREKVNLLTQRLDLELGPGTAGLQVRIGLHSGPVTAGVLRGQKARFQLFGDTVNTAARMESTGVPNHIHVSRKTAAQLRREHKGHWLAERPELVSAKGKGNMQTYFVQPQMRATSSQGLSSVESDEELELENLRDLLRNFQAPGGFRERLIDWNVVVLEDLLVKVVAYRLVQENSTLSSKSLLEIRRQEEKPYKKVNFSRSERKEILHGSARDEVLDTISLPMYDAEAVGAQDEIDNEITLSPQVKEQLRMFVSAIADSYPPNAFHNFEHASHVAMIAKKLLVRISAANEGDAIDKVAKKEAHFQTYGIKSDPLTQFAVVFAALIHDVEHPGVSNQQLVQERAPIAERYKNLSIAEQNSIDIAWDILMDQGFADLHDCIFPDMEEYQRFRQVVVNAVVTTDIFDRELKCAREARWDRTYGDSAETELPISIPNRMEEKDVIDRKATIVIELIIQVSDVSHTMQHWHVYQKWNKRLFQEVYTAYKSGRSKQNPTETWYDGELWFFDNYIIPLANKIRYCKVFGVCCDEFIDFATDNRLEWENKGRNIVAQWAAESAQGLMEEDSLGELSLDQS